jgi:acyl carrier protein
MFRLVCSTLARHTDCDARAIRSSWTLEHDLALTPLELVLIALEVEEHEGIRLPVEDLVSATTVGDLVSFAWNGTKTAR